MDEFLSDFSAGMLIKATNVRAYGCSKYNVRKLKYVIDWLIQTSG